MTFDSLGADVRLTLRRLLHAPVFAGITVLTLGLGIGASTAIFSVAHAVLLRPLPYADPDGLVAIWSNNTKQHETRNPVSPANFDAFKREAKSFAGMEAMYSFLVNPQIQLQDSKELVSAATVTAGMFDLIGRSAARGRGLRAGDDAAVVLSHGLWTRLYSADPEIVGKGLTFSGGQRPATIVGVMPQDFVFPYKAMLGPSGFTRSLQPDLWVYLPTNTGQMVDAAGQPNRNVHFLAVIGRLAPGATLDSARAELDAIAARRAATIPATNDGWATTALPLHEQVVGRVRPAVLLLLGGVGLLLLITCMNIANVMLARATGQQRDAAVRLALGASSGRLAQLALVESGVLAVLGGLAGVLVATLGTQAVLALAPADLPRLNETRFDFTVLAFALGLSAVTSLLVGLLPAVATGRAGMGSLAESHRTTASAARQRVRGGLVVAEIALATVLAVGGGLMLRSFVAVLTVDPGFNPAQLLTYQQFVPASAQTPAARTAFLEDLMEQLSSLPGVVHVGGSTRIPLGSTQVTTELTVDGRPTPAGSLPEVDMRRAVGAYFQAMGMPVVKGRVFEAADRTAASGLVVVNAALAAKVFPGEEAIGRRVRIGANPNAPWLTIIGVVGDIRHSSLEDEPRPEIYLSHLQAPPVSPFMVVRASGDPSSVIASARAAAKALGADPPFNLSTMDRLRWESVALRRFLVLLAGLFGVLALLLAAVGIYGVTALVIAERTDEVGVRMALGATPSRILAMIVSQAARLGVLGLALGLGAGAVLAQVARGMLYGVGPLDVVTFVAVPILLLAVALVAAVIPGRRATRISPAGAMRT